MSDTGIKITNPDSFSFPYGEHSTSSLLGAGSRSGDECFH